MPPASTLLPVRLDDTTLAQLQARADAARLALDELAARLLHTAVQILPAGGRSVVVAGDTLDQLESVLGGGSLLTPEDLLQKVETLAGISFFHVRLPYSPNQLRALTEKAARQSLTVEQLIERTAPRVYEQFFDLLERT